MQLGGDWGGQVGSAGKVEEIGGLVASVEG